MRFCSSRLKKGQQVGKNKQNRGLVELDNGNRYLIIGSVLTVFNVVLEAYNF